MGRRQTVVEMLRVAGVGHERLEELFSVALSKTAGAERATYLREACGDDSEMRSHVEGLLKIHARVGSFLELPPVDLDATIEVGGVAEAAPTRIGRYRILEEIGEGGFGCVYLAEQEEPVRRKVAIKVIKLGMDTKQVIARFEAERQALALMDHANIAKVLDAGATERGRPFFVMELVRGITITDYCDKHRLSTQERLELFRPICNALQHAHQKGIIHRDLKPNNVLVALDDGHPVPKVIDFGIAKATGHRLTEKTLFTGFREFLGTPEYMSPDQAEVGGPDVDTRSDIYSLGVLLYELLTGTTPLEAKTLRAVSYEDIRRVIQESEPPKPSARLLAMSAGEGADAFARSHRLAPSASARVVRGDLDCIVMKAIEKDRVRRYATAKDLADDIERHLLHEPVLAGPPSAVYKFRKFVRRHRVGVVVGAVAGAAVLAGLSLATVGLVQANRARVALRSERDAAEAARADEQVQRALAEAGADEARKQAARSAIVGGFLEEMLASVDPSRAMGREVSVRYILDEAVKRIDDGALSDHPEVEATVRTTLGETYLALGLYAAAEEHLRAAQRIRRDLLGDEHPDTLRSNRALAGVLRVRGRFSDAESLLRDTGATLRRVLGEDHPDTLATMTELALALWGPKRFVEAESIHRRTLELQRRVLGEEHIDTISSMGYLGAVCRELGKRTESEALLRRALGLCQSVLGSAHPRTGDVMNHLGLLLEDQGDIAGAEDLFRGAYELDARILGADHPRTLIPMNNLLRVLDVAGKKDASRPIVAERLAHLGRVASRDDATALALHGYAWELLHCASVDLRDADTALPVAERAVALDGGRDATLLATFALALAKTGSLDRAIETQELAVTRAGAGGPYNRDEFVSTLVDYKLESGDLLGAARVSWGGVGSFLSESLVTGSTIGAPLVKRSEALLAEGNVEEAVALLYGCLATRQKELPEGHWLVAETLSQLGAAIAQGGDFAGAESLLLDGYAGMHDNPHVPANRRARAFQRVILLYETWGKPERAEAFRIQHAE